MSDVNKVPSVYNFLYQPVAAEGESEKPAEKFLLGFDNDKYYLHNNLDYSNAQISLRPGTSFILETKTMELNASNSITISNGVTKDNILQHVKLANNCLDIYNYSFQIAPNNTKAVPRFSANAHNIWLKSTNNFSFQSQKGVLDFTSPATGSNKWCSAACFKNTYSAPNGAYDAVYIGVYKDNFGTARCALDARANDGTEETPAPLNIGLLSTQTVIGANNYEGLRVTTAKVGDTTRAVVSVKQNESWSEIASHADISGMLVNKNNWEVLEVKDNTYGWCIIEPGIYLIEVYDSDQDTYEGYTPLGAIETTTQKAIIQNFNLINIDKKNGRKYNIKNCILQKYPQSNEIRVVEYNDDDKGSKYNPVNKIRVKKLA